MKAPIKSNRQKSEDRITGTWPTQRSLMTTVVVEHELQKLRFYFTCRRGKKCSRLKTRMGWNAKWRSSP
jgi:hypothetical protein